MTELLGAGRSSSSQPAWQPRLTNWRHVSADALIAAAAFALSYVLRFDFDVPSSTIRLAVWQLPFFVAAQLLVFAACGVYRFIWRYTGIREVKTFVVAAALAATPSIVVRLIPLPALVAWQVPLSVSVLASIFTFTGTIAARVLMRLVCERRERRLVERVGSPLPILVIGAGTTGRIVADEIRRVRRADLAIQGFVDDDPFKQNAVVHGVRVLGTTSDLRTLVRDLAIDHVVLAIAHASRRDIRRILQLCEAIPVTARVVPSVQEILQGEVTMTRIHNVQIDDLLSRAPVDLCNEAAAAFLVGKRVLVTGAGGSIGSELARQICRRGPEHLVLVERAEFALFNIHHELNSAFPGTRLTPVVADVGNRARMSQIFSEYAPEVVIHAAAHKHVSLMEVSAAEAVANNVFATRSLGELSASFGVDVFVLISSDKAVRPTSVMGASKRLAELAIQSLNRDGRTRFVAVRFGNVIGSSGSVIPIFRSQIANGGPITITHPDMTRYFMTIPEAAQLVLEAATLGRGGEIFVLDMGEPVRIVDLAIDLINRSGLRPFEDIDIVFTGIRPGEKLFEEIEMGDERMSRTQHPKIFVGKICGLSDSTVAQALHRLERAVVSCNQPAVKRILNDVIPEAVLAVATDADDDLPLESTTRVVVDAQV
jgi:FlaA1/EpsC-like NDP-sugar epimerase